MNAGILSDAEGLGGVLHCRPSLKSVSDPGKIKQNFAAAHMSNRRAGAAAGRGGAGPAADAAQAEGPETPGASG